jgi:hypothetical protein
MDRRLTPLWRCSRLVWIPGDPDSRFAQLSRASTGQNGVSGGCARPSMSSAHPRMASARPRITPRAVERRQPPVPRRLDRRLRRLPAPPGCGALRTGRRWRCCTATSAAGSGAAPCRATASRPPAPTRPSSSGASRSGCGGAPPPQRQRERGRQARRPAGCLRCPVVQALWRPLRWPTSCPRAAAPTCQVL